MKILIYATTLTTYTSGIPMRGLVLESIKLRPYDDFILYFNQKDKDVPYLKSFFKQLEKFNNINLVFEKFSKKWINLKALLGWQNYLTMNQEADLYFSPGTLDFFGKKNRPLINILTDLSEIRTPKYPSIPWHGKYILQTHLRYSSQYSSKIICISEYTKNDLLSIYPQIKEKTHIIYNGIENQWFDAKFEETRIERFTNFKNGYWIWYGYISKRKNILNLLKAYNELEAQFDKATLPKILLVGKLATNQFVIQEYVKSNLNDEVKIIPHQDIYKLKYLVSKSRGLLFPSFYEGFGLPVIEAFSQGKPVMSSNVSSLPEIAGGLGISCDPYSIESIKQALLNMFGLKDNEEDISKRKKWASNFTYERAAQEFSKVIDEVKKNNGN